MEPLDPEHKPHGTSPPRTELRSGAGESGRRALEDVLEAEEQTLRSTLGSAELDELHYEGLETAIKSNSVAMNTGASSALPKDDGGAANEGEGGDGLGAGELAQLVQIYESGEEAFELIDRGSLSLERAQVLLHVAALDLELGGASGLTGRDMGLRVDAALREAQPDLVHVLLQQAIVDMAEALDSSIFDSWMEVAHPFLSKVFKVPIESLQAISVQASPEARVKLAPHVVDEYLTLLPSRMPPLDERVLEVPQEDLEGIWTRLAGLRALGRGLMKPGAFRLGDRFSYPIVLRIARTRLVGMLAPVLSAAFLESMPVDPGARFCVLAHRRPTDELAWVLAAQLEDPRSPLSLEAGRSAAWVLVGGLQALEPERRDESWIAEAIGWLGTRDVRFDADVQLMTTRALLQRVISDRRGVVHSWAREARRAAKAALKSLPQSLGEASSGGA